MAFSQQDIPLLAMKYILYMYICMCSQDLYKMMFSLGCFYAKQLITTSVDTKIRAINIQPNLKTTSLILFHDWSQILDTRNTRCYTNYQDVIIPGSRIYIERRITNSLR